MDRNDRGGKYGAAVRQKENGLIRVMNQAIPQLEQLLARLAPSAQKTAIAAALASIRANTA